MDQSCFGYIPRGRANCGASLGENFRSFNVGIPERIDIDRSAIAMTGESFSSRDGAAIKRACYVGAHESIVFAQLGECWANVLNREIVADGARQRSHQPRRLQLDARSVFPDGSSGWMMVGNDDFAQQAERHRTAWAPRARTHRVHFIHAQAQNLEC